MRFEKRIGFLFLIIGLSLVAISFTGYKIHQYGPPEPIEGDAYFGYAFGSGGSFHIYAESWSNGSQTFSLYLLTIEDTLTLLEEQTLDNTDPLIEVHGVMQYDQLVSNFPPGKYGVVGISDDGSDHTITIRVTTIHPFPEILLTGLVSIGLGVIVLTTSLIIRRKQEISG